MAKNVKWKSLKIFTYPIHKLKNIVCKGDITNAPLIKFIDHDLTLHIPITPINGRKYGYINDVFSCKKVRMYYR